MKKALSTKMILFGIIGLIAMSAVLVAGSGSANAASMSSYWNDGHRFGYQREVRRIVTDRDRPIFRVVNIRNYMDNYGRFRFRNIDRDFFPRNVIIYDRYNPAREIIIRNTNYLTGPFSTNINVVRVGVSNDFFDRVSSNIDVVRNDIDMTLNTGDNTISFNTVVGNISTGDINVSIR